jgi:beta-phosphoglucomutase
MDAMIFDFDGVIVDSEPVHLECFQRALAEVGVPLAREDYYSKYLGYDDHDCFAAALRDAGKEAPEALIADLTRSKSRLVRATYARGVAALPGAVELIRAASAAGVPLAVCSGALREEIAQAAGAIGVLECFSAIVAARDVAHGKPDPEGYKLAMDRLRSAAGDAPASGARRPIRAGASVVIEDSPAGVEAAKSAGLKVLAVTNSYGPTALSRADRVVDSLANMTLHELSSIAR